MYKKKELIIIVILILLSVLIACIPAISCSGSEGEVSIESTESNYINVTVKGEISKESIELKIPKGYTYGYVIEHIRPYLNKYSVIDSYDLTLRFNEDSNIYIRSLDTNISINIEEVVLENRININSATKKELITLYNIGDKRAEGILNYISQNGPIKSFEELKSLVGISDEAIEVIKKQAIL